MSNNSKIHTILIANRGEIAVRVIETAKKMGIKTVAIYSDVDAQAKFVQKADVAIPIGGITSRESYLDIEKVIKACKMSGANAVHPGYGFLSEKSEFVERCAKEGIIFVGPSAKSMEMMGDKITSKETAKKAGVNVVPGFLGIIDGKDHAEKIASEIGFPVIIKASAGGGGKGMKIVYDIKDLWASVESAKNEAKNAFGDDRLFIEKYIERPHHIEIQLIADKHGNVVCLGERECSIQRFNQKVIEESPSPSISEKTRSQMYEQSVKLAKECGYFSAGTIEFVMDGKENFYFLEMNTRLQVEHPVTEYVTGKDLVQLMIKIAEGEKLPFTQDEIKINGWSMEARICAEDPSKGFMPSIGRISHYKEPREIHNVKFRIDSGVLEGSEISPYYDSMIAKVITHGSTRAEAIESMKKTLGQFELAGISTNINLVEDIIRNKDFKDGKISTWFIKENYPDGFKGIELSDDGKISIIAAIIKLYITNEAKRWKTSGQFALTRDPDDRVLYIKIGDEQHKIRYSEKENGDIAMYINNIELDFSSNYKYGDTILKVTIKGEDKYIKILHLFEGSAKINYQGSQSLVQFFPRHIGEYTKHMPIIDTNKKPDNFESPITGMLVKLCINEGDKVLAGQELCVIEAMKMENVIRAEFDTTIRKIHKEKGAMLSVGDLVIDFDNTQK
ncbi:acetyl-CoA carboxylase biotin carboxylase subunit [Candidatus Deianiraea vastatrix]|uniref:propionyl-CoA carboxylase n=1 Tax=Candidatus Deianiraea vastatrix TaxID=2163644 RepID=A0A5B8XF55_9RICK|nr:acetyl-CoA carboxylase biotin carboxylase subunit [Candidatus Deianiraea vastatrix]QED23913.1 Putative acyl-CoA carboxylase, biotin carboxylase component [Candidatus Deianiraea vastatrix]